MTRNDFLTLYKDVSKGLSAFGGLQGAKGTIFGFSYPPGGLVDHAIEGSSGLHDQLNSYFYYDALGNNIHSASSGLNGIWNYLNLIPAIPVGIGSVNNSMPGFITNVLNTVRVVKDNADKNR